MENGNGRGPKADSTGSTGSLLNGHSLSRLAGAVPSAKLVQEVRLPAARMADVLETIHQLGHAGKLSINFAHGKAVDMVWSITREAKPHGDL
jgi:hypothetical protein